MSTVVGGVVEERALMLLLPPSDDFDAAPLPPPLPSSLLLLGRLRLLAALNILPSIVLMQLSTPNLAPALKYYIPLSREVFIIF